MRRTAAEGLTTVESRLNKIGARISRFTHRLSGDVEAKMREVERAKAIGSYWQEVRLDRGMERRELSALLDVDETDLVAFEAGFMHSDDFPSDLVKRMAEALGDAAIYDEFRRKFEN